MARNSLPRLIPLLVAAATACGGGGGSTPPPDNMTTTVTSVSGDEQAGRVGEVLAEPLQVVVTDGGQPAADVTVSWSTTDAGGVLTPASGTTDADGRASTSWTLGSVAGRQTARATVSGASGSPVTFGATAVGGPAAALAKAGGDGQTGETNAALASPLQAKVTDQFGNAVAGTEVSWSSSGASVSAPTVATDASGISQITVTLGGVAGSITITAASEGLAGTPQTFTATAVAPVPPPSDISITVGNDFFQSDRNGSVGPAVDTVAIGGRVTWNWGATAVLHNVTSNPPPSFTSSPTQAAGTSYQFTFSNPGVYRYYCTLHASAASTTGMIGRIVVK